MGFNKGYSIVKAYVSSRKMDKEIPNHNASSGETAAETGGRQTLAWYNKINGLLGLV